MTDPTSGPSFDEPFHFERHPLCYVDTHTFALLLVLRAKLPDRHLLRLRNAETETAPPTPGD